MDNLGGELGDFSCRHTDIHIHPYTRIRAMTTTPGCEFIPRSDPPSSVYCLRSIIFSAQGREEETILRRIPTASDTHSHIRIDRDGGTVWHEKRFEQKI